MVDVNWLSKALLYYKRKDIQEAIIAAARDKEAVGSFKGEGYAKRPDTLMFPNDVLEQVKKGITSFHVSEELWRKPLDLVPGMQKKDIESNRKGWDLVIDIDCKDWELAKVSAHVIVLALHDFGVQHIGVKFSGNKGFHLGVAFNAFSPQVSIPQLVGAELIDVKRETRELFPEAARHIAAFLLDYIREKYIVVEEDAVTIAGKKFMLKQLESSLGKKMSEFSKIHCSECDALLGKAPTRQYDLLCTTCGSTKRLDEPAVFELDRTRQVMHCAVCNSMMTDRVEVTPKACDACGSSSYHTVFDPTKLIEVDTILISTRHLYRAPYSLHEKSGLASVPIAAADLLTFDKACAQPEGVVGDMRFMDSSIVVPGEGDKLLLLAMRRAGENELAALLSAKDDAVRSRKEFTLKEKVPVEEFPPCIMNILRGLKDGKKRAVFVLSNFLLSVGWTEAECKQFIHEWNQKNPDPLREGYLHSQIRGKGKKPMPPPNCDNKMYYRDLGICTPDAFCARIKNPAAYAVKKIMIKTPRTDKGEPVDKKASIQKGVETRAERKKFKEDVQRKRESGEME